MVAVAAAAETLHHDLAHGHLSGLAGYAMVFFAIWWAWVNYSWFASAYDTDDVIFRLLTFVVVAGYLIMRVAMIPLWLRVSREHPHLRRTALRYAGAIAVIQVLWVLRTIFLADGTVGWVSFVALALLEMAGPWWVYFKRPMVDSVSRGTSFAFGYGHYFVFASIAAVGACLATRVDVLEHAAHVESRTGVLLLGLAPGTSVLLRGLAIAASLADYLRRTNRT